MISFINLFFFFLCKNLDRALTTKTAEGSKILKLNHLNNPWKQSRRFLRYVETFREN